MCWTTNRNLPEVSVLDNLQPWSCQDKGVCYVVNGSYGDVTYYCIATRITVYPPGDLTDTQTWRRQSRSCVIDTDDFSGETATSGGCRAVLTHRIVEISHTRSPNTPSSRRTNMTLLTFLNEK